MHRKQKTLTLQILVVLILAVTGIHRLPATSVKVSGEPSVPCNPGNWTYISKPVYPAKINANQIPIGHNWTYVYTLSKSCSYHVYIYGDWIGSQTDYDIYVYNPQGDLETVHTEAAGLPEHLGTTVTEPFFTPKYSGNYSFLIVNDRRESQGAGAATMMLIEHIECNKWYQCSLQGKVNFTDVYKTKWAYEFVTNGTRVQVWIDVPNTLDMYEARLYIMANPSKQIGSFLNGVPLAWEPGLYNKTDSSKLYGGYNLDNEGFRHPDATASCEYPGEDMLINYVFPSKADTLLYHLVLIGEHGEGDVRFMVKTDFNPPMLSIRDPAERVHSNNDTTITVDASDEESGISSVLLTYTTDSSESWASLEMSPSQNHTYVGTIPGQRGGSTVRYMVDASDKVGNTAEVQGSYVVKDTTTLTFSLSKLAIYANESIVVTGRMSCGGATVTLKYVYGDLPVLRFVKVDQTGFFKDEYAPRKVGFWMVSANWSGDEAHYEAYCMYQNFTVEKIPTSLDCTVGNEAIDIGNGVTIRGTITPARGNVIVELEFKMPNGSVIERYAPTVSNGTFSLDFRPDMPGSWRVQGRLADDALYLPSNSESKSFVVNDTWMNNFISFISQYMTYILIAAGAAASISVVFVYLRRRE